MDDSWQPTLSDELKAELDKRLAESRSDSKKVFTLDVVLAYVRRAKPSES